MHVSYAMNFSAETNSNLSDRFRFRSLASACAYNCNTLPIELVVCLCNWTKPKFGTKWDGMQMIYWHVYNDDWWVWIFEIVSAHCCSTAAWWCHDWLLLRLSNMLIVEKFVSCRHPTSDTRRPNPNSNLTNELYLLILWQYASNTLLSHTFKLFTNKFIKTDFDISVVRMRVSVRFQS